MARSSSFLVICSSPSLKFLETATGRVPWPIWMPVGTWVFSDEEEPGGRMVSYSRSWNSARLRLKPVVATLAMLLAITSMFTLWACIPDAADHMLRIICPPYLTA